MGDTGKIQEKTHAALMALVAMYESVKEDQAGAERHRNITIDVTSADVVERWNTLAREHRAVGEKVKSQGLPDELKALDYRDNTLTAEQVTAANENRRTLLVEAVQRRAEALEWMASRVAPGMVFRLVEDQASTLWGPVPELRALLRSLVS